ncbi:MAG TPA: DUF2145 domain-containing protein [Burkholderiaceae bacterium]
MGRAWLLAAWFGAATAVAHAASGSPQYCDRPTPPNARQQDRLLQFAAVIRRELEASGQDVALIARSGIDLARFNLRYSHAGVSLKASSNARWSVRQLYFACDEGRPRLYDQGLAGFVLGTDNPSVGYVSIVWLPRELAAPLERTALDNARALRLLAAEYSANAYPFSLRYQNCNQWVAELLATAWGNLDDSDALRRHAQGWLMEQRYEPQPVEVGSHLLMFAGHFVPWIHYDDHPESDRYALRLRTSLPTSIEAFVQAQVPAARRIELCHDEQRVVIRRGWSSFGEGCRPGPADEVIALD